MLSIIMSISVSNTIPQLLAMITANRQNQKYYKYLFASHGLVKAHQAQQQAHQYNYHLIKAPAGPVIWQLLSFLHQKPYLTIKTLYIPEENPLCFSCGYMSMHLFNTKLRMHKRGCQGTPFPTTPAPPLTIAAFYSPRFTDQQREALIKEIGNTTLPYPHAPVASPVPNTDLLFSPKGLDQQPKQGDSPLTKTYQEHKQDYPTDSEDEKDSSTERHANDAQKLSLSPEKKDIIHLNQSLAQKICHKMKKLHKELQYALTNLDTTLLKQTFSVLKPFYTPYKFSCNTENKWFNLYSMMETYWATHSDNSPNPIAQLGNYAHIKKQISHKVQALADQLCLADILTIPFDHPKQVSKYYQTLDKQLFFIKTLEEDHNIPTGTHGNFKRICDMQHQKIENYISSNMLSLHLEQPWDIPTCQKINQCVEALKSIQTHITQVKDFKKAIQVDHFNSHIQQVLQKKIASHHNTNNT